MAAGSGYVDIMCQSLHCKTHQDLDVWSCTMGVWAREGRVPRSQSGLLTTSDVCRNRDQPVNWPLHPDPSEWRYIHLTCLQEMVLWECGHLQKVSRSPMLGMLWANGDSWGVRPFWWWSWLSEVYLVLSSSARNDPRGLHKKWAPLGCEICVLANTYLKSVFLERAKLQNAGEQQENTHTKWCGLNRNRLNRRVQSCFGKSILTSLYLIFLYLIFWFQILCCAWIWCKDKCSCMTTNVRCCSSLSALGFDAQCLSAAILTFLFILSQQKRFFINHDSRLKRYIGKRDNVQPNKTHEKSQPWLSP